MDSLYIRALKVAEEENIPVVWDYSLSGRTVSNSLHRRITLAHLQLVRISALLHIPEKEIAGIALLHEIGHILSMDLMIVSREDTRMCKERVAWDVAKQIFEYSHPRFEEVEEFCVNSYL